MSLNSQTGVMICSPALWHQPPPGTAAYAAQLHHCWLAQMRPAAHLGPGVTHPTQPARTVPGEGTNADRMLCTGDDAARHEHFDVVGFDAESNIAVTARDKRAEHRKVASLTTQPGHYMQSVQFIRAVVADAVSACVMMHEFV